MPSRTAFTRAAFCLLSFIVLSSFFSVAKVSALPDDFTDEFVTNISSPTALAFTPDGRLLIATQGGQLRVFQNNALLATPAVNLNSRLCTNSERGLLGVAVDPQFATNRFVYFYYTFNNAGNCVNRVARFVLADNNTINTASETVLIDKIHSTGGYHNAGDLHFGKDNLLYISVGDAGCDYAGDSGCAGQNDAARDKHVLLGKILRITRDGAIPAGNPYQGANSGRCNVTGSTTVGNWCQETFASGLRNPFRFSMDPNASGTRFFINDVGQETWEEINEGVAGADYGWNTREGRCARGSTTNCSAPPAGFTNPIFDYPHTDTCPVGVSGNAITGGVFVPNGVWTSEYDDSYFFGEYVCGKLFRIKPNGTGGYTASEFNALSTGSVTSMIFGPYQTTQALYYTNYTGGGQLRRVRYTGTANRNPVASATANPTSGNAPLDVVFNASASSDADGDTLSFSWNFDDGTTGTGATPTHRYQTGGTYNAVVTVTDGRGGSDTATVRIDVDNNPPQPTIVSPTSTQLFRVGETITLQGSATDAQDGNLPNSSLTWQVLLHHNNDHTHPFLPPTAGNNVTFTAPAPEDLAAAIGSFLEIRLTATDSNNLSTTIVQYFQPRKTNVTLATDPAGLNLTVNNTTVTSGTTFVSWDGYALSINAPNQTFNNQQYNFKLWSDCGAQAHTITTPSAAATYTATFQNGTTPGTLSGAIQYAIAPLNRPSACVPGVNLNATGTTQPSATSDNLGFYQLSGITAGGNYRVTPSKIGTVSGITPFDATLVLRHVAAGTGGTLTASQRTAADTNNSGTITPFDATQILRAVAANGQTNATGNVGNWKFDPPERTYTSIGSSMSNQNYTAILIGEVDGSWASSANFAAMNDEGENHLQSVQMNEKSVVDAVAAENSISLGEFVSIPFETAISIADKTEKEHQPIAEAQISTPENISAATGDIVLVPVAIAGGDGKQISSYSFVLNFNPNVLQPEVAGVETTDTLSENGFIIASDTKIAGRIGIAASSLSNAINASGTLLYLRFKVIGTAQNSATGSTDLIFSRSTKHSSSVFENNMGNRVNVAAANGSLKITSIPTKKATFGGRVSALTLPDMQNERCADGFIRLLSFDQCFDAGNLRF